MKRRPSNQFDQFNLEISRRSFLGGGFAGLGSIALTSVFGNDAQAVNNPKSKIQNPQSKGVVNPLHYPQKAKRVIFLYQAGGPSHLETLDYKPKLAEMN